MRASGGRFLYELVFWVVVGGLVYINRGLYEGVRNQLEPVLQAYTDVALLVMGIALFLLVLYLREAIASTFIYTTERITGANALNYEKGNTAKNIQRTARRLMRKGNYEAAGEAYESLELWRDAATVYEKGNCFGRAAIAWQQAGNLGKAIELFEKDNNFQAAGDICTSEGLLDRATRNYRIAAERCMQDNQFASAAEFYERAFDYSQAGSIFETAHKPDRALSCYEKARNPDKILELLNAIHPGDYLRRGPDFTRVVQRSAEVLVSSGHEAEAAKILEDCHDLTRAAEVYSSCKMWEKAAELYMKSDRQDMAAAMVRKIDDKRVAADLSARMASGNADWQAAGENFEAAGKNNQAIDAYKKARNFEAAARLYESMGRFIMAGEMYSSGRNLVAAANAYAKAYDWRNAAECFEQSGDLAQAIEAYANASNHLKAGIIALKLTDYARAIEYLQRVPSGSPDFQLATAFLATAFFYQGHFDMAYELFERVMDTLPLNKDTLPAHYAYARNLETENPKKSLSLFRQILGVDVHYSDAADRAQRLEQIVTSISGYGNNTPIPTVKTPNIVQSTPLNGAVTPYPHKPTYKTQPATLYTAAENRPSQSIPFPQQRAGGGASMGSTLLEGRYQLEEILSQYGRVTDYKGTDTATNRRIFVRAFTRPADPAVYNRTMESLAAASRLSHPNINSIVYYGESAGLMFVVTDVVSGTELRQWIRSKGPLSIADTRHFAGQLLQALEYSHAHGTYHLNLRPDVIFLLGQSNEQVILSGFGTPSRQTSETESIYSTMPDSDPQYMAPEQIVGGKLDERTDVYAAGLILFFILTGRTPFEVKRVNDTQEIARMQVQVSLARPSTIRATLPSSVDDIFLKCVHKTPASRYESISALLADINNLQPGTII